ncbi:zinc metalloprotease [Chlorella sorokiniana]|uniref:Zinc metalloprotease n=1 Tax=Chlorella sorokiniana TaxID=3076 RepID=A0A2P6TTI2_CHLSO|nr:zinc metalloprotease [Chlorella sorokiniana]|eukprot:PRW57372.1 zinc metalloprotease [Chlorella sorokiniana]
MVATLQQLPARLLQASGARGLLAAAGSRLAHSTATSSIGLRGREEEGKPVHHAVPASLPEVPPRWRPAPQQQLLCLASINDPETWGLASVGPSQDHQERGEAAGFFWLGSSLSNPKEPPARSSSPLRSSSSSSGSPQAFRTAESRQEAAQRKVVFRSSMLEPELPFAFKSSMTDPPLRS